MTALLVALGAAIGTPLRLVAGHALDRSVPWGTLVVNLAGSFGLGLCVGWSLDGAALALVGTGFCGGLTTFSAFAVQTVDLAGVPEEDGAPGRGRARSAAYALATVLGALAACGAGVLLAR